MTLLSNSNGSGASSGNGSKLADNVGELTRTAGLLLVFEVVLGRLRGGFAVADLRCADIHLHFVFAANALHVNIEVQFAHAGDNRFAGFFIGADAERRIFAAEALQCLGQLIVGIFAIGDRDRHFDDRLGNEHAFQRAELMASGA